MVATLLAVFIVSGIAFSGGGVAATDSPEFEKGITTVTESEAATLTIDSGTAESVDFTINGQEAGYELAATVTTNDDGKATLRFNHSATATDVPTVTATGDATVTINTETNLSDPIDSGNYDLQLSAPDTTEPADIGTLIIESASSESTTEPGDDEASPDDSQPQPVEKDTAEEADIIVETRDDQRIAVPVEAADSADATIRVRSDGGESPFLLTQETSVNDGVAAATFNFSDVNHGTTATVDVRHDGTTTKPVEVIIVNPTIGIKGVDDIDQLTTEREIERETNSEAETETQSNTDSQTNDTGATHNYLPGFGLTLTVIALSIITLLATRS